MNRLFLDKISYDTKDFLSSLMNYDNQLRMSIREALKHKWVLENPLLEALENKIE